ncbi:hypothetical protein [Bacillus sp. NEB1478]|uniref:hypothetical protein n=1 Tax=Bacillus sp. NEB1478 TaxID=3073816 RepID=UPI002873123B|nr:hypothetical protein [Bacillus sp. NEB1478]WNB93784.1 hypothetical protein RGB74_08980 [Bacillus sp. NEB1478]
MFHSFYLTTHVAYYILADEQHLTNNIFKVKEMYVILYDLDGMDKDLEKQLAAPK